MKLSAFFTRRKQGFDTLNHDSRPHRAGADTGTIDLHLRQAKPRPTPSLADELAEWLDWIIAGFRDHPVNMTCFAILMACAGVGITFFLDQWFPTFDPSIH